MGAILSFVPRDAASKNAKPAPQEAAAIIIFPGVRYEKHGMPTSAAPGRATAERESPPAKH